MNEWTQTARRIGMWSATTAATIGLVFVIVGLIGLLVRPGGSEPPRQVDPYLAILETLMILFAVVLVAMMSALHACAPPNLKTFSLTALAFIICFAVPDAWSAFRKPDLRKTDRSESLVVAASSTLHWRLAYARNVAGLTRMGLLSGAGITVYRTSLQT